MTTTQPLPTVAAVIAFLGWSNSPRNTALVSSHLEHVTALAHGHTRGRGFVTPTEGVEPSGCAAAIAQVIVSATARSCSNPTRAYKTIAGTVETTPNRFEGWTLLERQTLDRFRLRVA